MILRRHPTLYDHVMSLMLSSTRPVQALMGWCGMVAALGLWTAQLLQTWTPMDLLIQHTSYWFVIGGFVAYSVMSLTSAILDFRSSPWLKFKYIATIIGITLWVICLASSFGWSAGGLVLRDGMSFLYIIPVISDTWVLIQMLSGVEKLERRR